jgi:phosphatidylglycerol:prolipoprotein diacylglycerol transferase
MINFTPVPTVDLGFYKLSTHGLLIAAGFLVAELLARREAKRRGLSADVVDDAAIAAVLAGLVGARLVYIATLGRGMSFLDMLEVWKGGLSSHGGYVFGILAGLLYFKFKKVDLFKYADAVIPYMLVGWAIGRIGCFLNWDSYGKPTNVAWAVVVNGEPRHPTQLYESFGYLAAFFLVSLKKTRSRVLARLRPGSEAATALALFALVRIVVDFFRDDPPAYLFTSRCVTVALFILCAAFVYWPTKTKKVVI